jgi:hypothetical protein
MMLAKCIENLFSEIKAELFPNLGTELDIQLWMDTSKKGLLHIILQLNSPKYRIRENTESHRREVPTLPAKLSIRIKGEIKTF